MGARFALAAALAWWAGLVLAPGAATPVVCALVAPAIVLLALPRLGARRLAAALLLLGLARGAAGDARARSEELTALDDSPAWRLVGIVDAPPLREGDAPSAVVRVLAASPRLARGVRVRLRLPPRCEAEWADTVEVLARLTPPRPARVPGGRDARRLARSSGTVAGGQAITARVRPARGVRFIAVQLAMRVRRGGEQALARGLSPAARELATPLLFGDRSGMESETDAALRGSGLVHLLALSGLHVGWLAAVVRTLVATLGGGVVMRAAAGALAALAFALVAGPIPSLARAVAGEALAALAAWRERALDPLQNLGLSALLLLAARPEWAGDLGFQLSCAATLGLVAVGGPLALRGRHAPRACRGLARGVATSLGAQLAVVPWLLSQFHALPWTSLVANLVGVPVSEAFLAAAALAALAEGLLPGAGQVWLSACEPLAALLHGSIEWFGGWPGALLATGSAAWLACASALAVAALAYALDPPRALDARGPSPASRTHAGRLAAVLVVAVGIGVACVRPLAPPAARWWLVVLDVGQGDAIAVATREGWWLVDAGPRSPRWDAGERVVLPFLRWAGVRRLERVVLTHDDGDHTGGMRALRRGIPVASGLGAAPVADVPGACVRFGLAPLARGDTLAGSPHVRVAWPPRDGEPAGAVAGRGDNAASLVLELGSGAGRALLMADTDSLVEAQLDLAAAPALLKVGHHGSGSSSGGAWLLRLRPARAAISCGARNPHGHPEAGALARLEAAGADVDRTDLEGSLWYELSPAGVRRLDWGAGEPGRLRERRPAACGSAGACRSY